MKCDLCEDKKCSRGKDCWEVKGNIEELYSTPEDKKILQVSTAIEGNFYMEKTRVEEVIVFSREMGYKRLGVAFCLGMEKEAQTLCSFLRRHFTVYSVCCKVCGVAKEDFGLKKIENNSFETMCNPLMQAKVLEDKKTELNIIVGLCLGHDLLFNKYSHAPVTTLIVKDRLLAHNPAGALYSRYYQHKILANQEIEKVAYE